MFICPSKYKCTFFNIPGLSLWVWNFLVFFFKLEKFISNQMLFIDFFFFKFYFIIFIIIATVSNKISRKHASLIYFWIEPTIIFYFAVLFQNTYISIKPCKNASFFSIQKLCNKYFLTLNAEKLKYVANEKEYLFFLFYIYNISWVYLISEIALKYFDIETVVLLSETIHKISSIHSLFQLVLHSNYLFCVEKWLLNKQNHLHWLLLEFE